MGETTTRFDKRISRSENGANMGARRAPLAPACAWNHASADPSHSGSRRRRFSWLIRCERVRRE
jgi:hypothetical protein